MKDQKYKVTTVFPAFNVLSVKSISKNRPLRGILNFASLMLLLSGIPQGTFAQVYDVSYHENSGNPGGINTEFYNNTTDWNVIIAGSQTANSWSTVESIPFPFEFYGNAVSNFKVSGNGVLTFSTAATAIPSNSNTNLPAPSVADIPDLSILGFWDSFTGDGTTGGNDEVMIKTFGTAPKRQLWIKYNSYEYGDNGSGGAAVPFDYWAIVLEEGTNKVYIIDQNASIGVNNLSSTIGIQENASNALQFGDNLIAKVLGNSSITDNDYYEFLPIYDNDAGISNITSPSNPLSSGLQNIDITLNNFGANTLNSVTINWRINGIIQTPFAFSGSLASLTNTPLNIGSFNFPTGQSILEVWTSNPNGLTDDYVSNDTLSLTLRTPLTGGIYTIGGSSFDFPDIQSAVEAINQSGVGGAVTFNINSGTYTGEFSINEILGASASNTITFDGGNAANTIITYDGSNSNQNSVIELNGADYVTFKNLSIVNSKSTTYGWGIHLFNEADHNTFENCKVTVDATTSEDSFIGILASGSKTSTGSYSNNANNTSIIGSEIEGGHFGIRFLGQSSSFYSNNNKVENTTIRKAYRSSVFFQYQEDLSLLQNNIIDDRLENSGLEVSNSLRVIVSQNLILVKNGRGAYVRNSDVLTFTRNRIGSDLKASVELSSINAGSFIAANRSLILNNLIYSKQSKGFDLRNVRNTIFVYNSVGAFDRALELTGNPNTVGPSLLNNIFVSESKEAIYTTGGTSSITPQYNLYYTPFTTLARADGTDYPSLSDWKTGAFGTNSGSIFGNPYLSVYNKGEQLQPTSSIIKDEGVQTGVIGTDINGTSRGSFPDLGAEEVNFTACSAPNTMNVHNITENSVELDWTSTGAESNWDFEWKIGADFYPGQGEEDGSFSTTSKPHNWSGLTSKSTYYFYLRADCGSAESFWVGPFTFNTVCSVIDSYPYNEDFEDLSIVCWSQSAANEEDWIISETTIYGATQDHTSGSGNFISVRDAAPHTPTDISFELAVFDLSSLNSPVLTFWMQNHNIFGADYSDLFVDVYDGTIWHNSVLSIVNTEVSDWTQFAVNITDYKSSNSIIRFRAKEHPLNFRSDISIDDIKVENSTVVCAVPLALTLLSQTPTNANITWQKGALETNWEVEYGEVGFIQGTGSVVQVTGGNPTLEINGLTENTNYECYVRANCGSAVYSDWSTALEFSTNYCGASSTTNTHFINDFVAIGLLSNISNVTSGYATNGYSLNPLPTVSHTPNEIVEFNATLNTAASGFNIWVDWNKDLDFDDSGEKVYTLSSSSASIAGSFAIPASQAGGNYRMRIRTDAISTDPPACGVSSGQDETEDYTLNVFPCSSPLVINANDNGCSSLRYIVANASAGDTIRFSPTINADTIKLTTGQILVDKALTIIGNGKDSTIIDGQALDRIFEISAAGSLVLDSLTLQNGDVSSKTSPNNIGGAILAVGGVTINKAVLRGNKANVGGAIASSSSSNDIFINASTFSNNEAVNQGGVIAFLGDTLSVESSTFSTNSASDAGVFYLLGGSSQTVLIDKSTFSGNTATSYAGAIYKENGKMEITNSTFFENSALVGAGALYIANGTAEIQNSIFKNTAPTDSDIFKETGVVFSDLGNNLVFSSAGAHGITDGNGIDPLLGPLADNGGPTQTHALLCGSPANNTGTGTGTDQRGKAVFGGTRDIGAFESQIFLDGSSPNTYTVTNTNDDGMGSLRYLANNACAGDTIRFDAAIDGDTIKLTSGQILINKNLVIIGNDSTKTIIDGQANDRIFEISSSINMAISKLTLQNGLTTNSGGAILNSGNLELADIKLLNSKALSGGAIYNNRNINISNSVIAGNEATNNGGGIYSHFGQINIKNSIIKGNKSLSDGGGLMNDGNASTFIWYSTIAGNEAGGNGGGIVEAAGNTLKLHGTLIANNNAGTGGKDLHYTVGNIVDEGFNHVQDAAGGHGITDGNGIDPLFMQNVPAAPSIGGDLRLIVCSPAINSGIADTTGLNLGLVDVAGNFRVFDGRIDIGAYEFQGSASATAIYVNKNATGANNGSSWANAYTDLQDAIDNQCGGLDIWVAAGTYLPTKDHTGNSTPTDNRDKNFHLSTDMKIYGGFAGTETLLSQRNATTNITILSGDFNNDDVVTGGGSTLSITNNTENAYHVFITANLTSAAVIDGFTFSGGNAESLGNITYQSQLFINNRGGGFYNTSSSPTLANCTFTVNSAINGGGQTNRDSSSPTMTNCIFRANSATSFGGGQYNRSSSSPIMTNCTFTANSATDGGGQFNNSSSPILTNCTFTSNSADDGSLGDGGGQLNEVSSFPILTNCTFTANSAYTGGGGQGNRISAFPTLINCTFTANTATIGGGQYNQNSNSILTNCTFTANSATIFGGGQNNDNGNPTLTNCIIWGNTAPSDANVSNLRSSTPTYTHSLIEGSGGSGLWNSGFGTDNGNNLDDNPLFVNAANGDLNLQSCSPAINVGTPDTTGLNLGLIDLAGNPRIIGGRIDIGAYERNTVPLEITTRTLAEFNELFVCENGIVKLPAGISSPDFTYQWQIDQGSGFSNLTEATPYSQTNADSLVISPIGLNLDGYQFRALIADACGGNVISDTITLRVGQLPVLVSSPLTQEVCPGNEVVLEAEFSGGGFYYQWQVDEGPGFVNVSGPNYTVLNDKLLISNFDNSKNNNQYRAVATSSCFAIPSNAGTITINTDVTILAQPTSQSVCEFGTAIFTAQAVKLSAGTLTYQWQRKAGTGNWIDVNTGGRYVVNGNQLQITNAPASWNGAEFRCLMNDYCQTIPKTLNVIPVAHVTQNPTSQQICVGNNANFSVTAAGEGLTYRWQVNNGSGFVNLTEGGIYQGVTSANLSLSFPTAAVNGYQYRCLVSGTSTCDLVADTSAVASISIGVSAEAQTVFYNSTVTTDEGITQAVGYILGINKILQPNGNAEYRAGNAILLNPGFEVEAGAVFSAKIMNPCQSVATSSGGDSSVPKELVK